MQSQRGFTLIELIVTISIISIVLTSGMLAIGHSIASNNLNSATLILASQIRTMQQISFAKQSTDPINAINMTFSKTPGNTSNGYNQYQILDTKEVKDNLPTIVLSGNITATITVTINNKTNNTNILTYDPTLANNNNVKTMVTLTSSALTTNNIRTIILSNVTGRIRIDSTNAPVYLADEI